jgi:hypothetical protein
LPNGAFSPALGKQSEVLTVFRSHAMQPVFACLGAGAAAILLAGCGISLSGGAASSSGSVSSSQLQHPVSTPLLGYLWDTASGSLRGVNGVPGAAVLATGGNFGSGFITAVGSAVQGYALLLGPGGSAANAARTGGLYIATLPGGTPHLLAAGPWTTISLSASGAYALAYSTTSQSAARITGLPQQPSVQAVNLSGIPQLRNAVVSDTGAALAATAASSGGIQLFAISPSTGPRAASTLASLGGVAFIPGTDTALAVDAASGAIQKIATVGSSPVVSTLGLGGTNGMPQSIGIDVTSDGHYAVLANAAGRFLRVDLTGGSQPMYAQCSCVPVVVSTLSGSAVRLTAPGSGPIWIVDAGGSALRSLFIPDVPNRGSSGTRSSGGAM